MSGDRDLVIEPLAQATGLQSCGVKKGLAAFGAKPRGERLERIQASSQWAGTRFANLIETPMAVPGAGLAWEYVRGGVEREPRDAIPVYSPEAGSLQRGRGEPLRLTWLGHSTVLLELDGALVLTDPVFGPRAAPVAWLGPRRFHAPPVEPEALPPLDVILISHDHYDHLDFPTITRLAHRDTVWVTSLGVGAHLEAWGVPPERIRELDWWEETEVAGLRIVATPARHFQGRGPGTSTATLWSSWVVESARRRVWFSGDTGPWDEGFTEIGRRFGGFDLTLIEIGAWHPAWGTIHLGPENAARVHQQVGGRTMMPVHWGTFNLALHAWDQPIVHLMELAEAQGIELLSPMMGRTVHRESGVDGYWRDRAARGR